MEVYFLNNIETIIHIEWDLICSWVIFSKMSKYGVGSKLAVMSDIFQVMWACA
jgi:hypothetical protein